ncbi:glutathione S-transferase 2-like [Neltuma alba]|uniref:glutathione S-transferase 2-like n=1 Tax=Neltuma alba TaxID=207710 RepID=UPI0010A40784|nr:glutathione S-transferase 2-like [Prosopis alba]
MATESGDNKLKLYSYWWSSCAFRVRIALNLKGIKYEYKAVNLLKGEHSHPDFLKLNPVGFVPVLVDGDFVISDSLAIIMYLEDEFTQRPLLPPDLQKRTINFQREKRDTVELPSSELKRKAWQRTRGCCSSSSSVSKERRHLLVELEELDEIGINTDTEGDGAVPGEEDDDSVKVFWLLLLFFPSI